MFTQQRLRATITKAMLLLRRPALRPFMSLRHRSSSTTPSRREFKVVLDNDTLYVEQPLAEALGWTPDMSTENGVPLTLRGWAPHYFAIARAGSDAGEWWSRVIVPCFGLILLFYRFAREGHC